MIKKALVLTDTNGLSSVTIENSDISGRPIITSHDLRFENDRTPYDALHNMTYKLNQFSESVNIDEKVLASFLEPYVAGD